MQPEAKPPTFDVLLTAITAAPSSGEVAMLLETARTYFAGTQREHLEAAAAARRTEFPNGDGGALSA